MHLTLHFPEEILATAHKRMVIGLCVSLSVLSILTACSATPTTSNAATVIPSTPAFTLTRPIQSSPTPTGIFSIFPSISPANASHATEIVRLTKGIIQQTVWLSDGKRLIVATTVGVYIYDVTNGAALRYFDTAPSPDIAISADGKRLATGERTIVRIWELETSQAPATLKIGGKRIQSIVFSPDLRTLAVDSVVEYSDGESVNEVRTVEVWDVTTAELLYSLLGRERPAFSPDGTLLAALYDGKIEFWDTATNILLNSIQGDFEFLFNPVGHSIAIQLTNYSSPSENSIKLFDTQTWQTHCTFEKGRWSSDLSFSPDGKKFAAQGLSDTIQVRDTASCQQLYSIAGVAVHVNLAFSPNGRILAGDHTIGLWDMSNGKLHSALKGFDGDLGGFSPDGKFLVERRWFEGTVSLWDIDTGKPALTLYQHTSMAGGLAFSPDGRFLTTGHEHGKIHVWSLDTAQIQSTMNNDWFSYVQALAFSPNAQIIAVENTDANIEFLDAKSGQHLSTLEGHTKDTWIEEIVFSPDGNLLASRGTDLTVRLWDLKTGQVRFVFILVGNDGAGGMAFSPDGKTIAIATSDRFISLWDVSNGELLFKLFTPSDGYSIGPSKLAFRQDGDTLVAAGYDTIWLWDLTNRSLLATTENAGNNIGSMAISPDGEILAISEWTGIGNLHEIKLWDINSQKLLSVLPGHTDRIPTLAFSPDGRLLASASQDGTVRIWGIRP